MNLTLAILFKDEFSFLVIILVLSPTSIFATLYEDSVSLTESSGHTK